MLPLGEESAHPPNDGSFPGPYGLGSENEREPGIATWLTHGGGPGTRQTVAARGPGPPPRMAPAELSPGGQEKVGGRRDLKAAPPGSVVLCTRAGTKILKRHKKVGDRALLRAPRRALGRSKTLESLPASWHLTSQNTPSRTLGEYD
jgi:hypothetical protein